MSRFKRRVRIYCDPKEVAGHMVHILDLETEKPVPHVARVRIDIDPAALNQARLLCYKVDAHDQYVLKDGEPLTEVATIEDVAVDITALEPLKRSEIAQMFVDALYEEAGHHKQYYLWRIADALRLDLDFGEDGDIPEKGIAP